MTKDIGLTANDKRRISAAVDAGHPSELLPGDGSLPGPRFGAADGSGDDADGRRDTEETETRDRVLTAGEYERLLVGALRIDSDRGLEAWAACVIMGRLGLRAGELCHLSVEWIDPRERILSIPTHDPCEKGRDDGPCGDCKQAIRQRQRNGDDRTVEEIATEYWQPKTERSARDIPYEWSPRAQEALSLLMSLHDRWPYAYSTLQRRLANALANAPGLSDDATTLHGLRGTAASYHAGNGVDKEALKQMMGWRGDRTPQRYIRINGKMTQRALRETYR